MAHQNRFDWNFAFDHGTLWHPSPPKSGFLRTKMRQPISGWQVFLLVPFLGEDFPKRVFFPTPAKKKANLARGKLAMLTSSSCYLRVDETVDPPIKTRSFKKIFWMFFPCPCSGNLKQKLTKCHSRVVDVFVDTYRVHRCRRSRKNWKSQGTGDAPFFCRKVSKWNFKVKSFSKGSIRLGWCLMFFFCFLVNFTNTPPKTNECPAKKGHFEKEKLVFQPVFFRVDILVFAGNRYFLLKEQPVLGLESPLVTYDQPIRACWRLISTAASNIPGEKGLHQLKGCTSRANISHRFTGSRSWVGSVHSKDHFTKKSRASEPWRQP